jgi:hypothetical protein
MKRDRDIILKRILEAEAMDPVSGARAIENIASSSPPPRTFSAAIASFLARVAPGRKTGAFHELVLDHLVSLGPIGWSQLLRVIMTAESAAIVGSALEHEAVALGSDDDRFARRLKLGLFGPDSDDVFGLLAQTAMARGHRWRASAWRERTNRTPEMMRAAPRIVWSVHGLSNTSFRRTPEGELLDCNDAPVALDAADFVSVPHSLDLGVEADQWSRVFAAYDIPAVFAQFDRTVAQIPDSWAKRDAVPLHRGVDRDQAVTHFVRNGWTLRRKGSRWYFDRMLRGPTVATISWHASDDVAHLIELYFASPIGAPLYLGDLDDVAYSEALLTLSELA